VSPENQIPADSKTPEAQRDAQMENKIKVDQGLVKHTTLPPASAALASAVTGPAHLSTNLGTPTDLKLQD